MPNFNLLIHTFIFIFLSFSSSSSLAAESSLSVKVDPGSFAISIRDSGLTKVEEEGLKQVLLLLSKKYLGKKGPKSVLTVGCSDGEELLVSHQVFGIHCEIIGCDISEREIEIAKNSCKAFKNIKALQLDLTSEDLSSLGLGYDLILIRHPEPCSSLYNDSSAVKWAKIFENSKNLLGSGGIIIVTCYFEAEAQFFSDRKGKDLSLVGEGKNPFFASKTHREIGQNFGKDFYIKIFKKKPSKRQRRSLFCR